MTEQIIICPNCNFEIELTEALTYQLQEKLKKEFDSQLKNKEKIISKKEQEFKRKEQEFEKNFNQKLKNEKEKFEKELKKKIEKQVEVDLLNLQNELKEKDQKLKDSRKKELELIKLQKDFEEKKKSFELDFERKIIQERKKIEKEYNKLKDQFTEQQEEMEKVYELKLKDYKKKVENDLKKKIEDNLSLELKDLRIQIKEQEEIIENSQKKELELIKAKRELEQKKKSFELEITKKIDEERKNIEEETSKRFNEQYRLKEAEKEKQINDMLKQIEELKRKAEQNSQQLQGEVLELELEGMLKSAFAYDSIEPVSKGQKGADVIQNVYDSYRRFCGTIIWETKRTKNWSDGWIDKLKNDQREQKAELAVLLTISMPKKINNFGYVDGVWVTNLECMIALATALRINLIELNNIKLASTGKNEKMELLYNYLSGKEFKQKIEGIVEAFTVMKHELDVEKRAITKIWAKREKQIARVFNNTVKMYGDMEGIIGNALPIIENFELNVLTADIDDTEEPEKEIVFLNNDRTKNNDYNNSIETNEIEDDSKEVNIVSNKNKIKNDNLIKNYDLFIKAALSGDFDKIEKFLNEGYDVNFTDDLGSTALIYASALGHESVVELLLENGANKDIADDQGMKAIDYAIEKGNKKINDLLT